MFSILGSVLSFLTILPGNDSLDTAARHMYLFPLAGLIVGLVAGSLGLGLSEAGAEPLIVGLIVAAALAIITGIHHTDGLADFADGLMVRGSRQKKLAAMKDVTTGSAGVSAVVLYFIGMVVALSHSSGYELFLGILLAEITAKFSMVLMAAVSRSAAPGSALPFITNMNRPKLFVASLITVIPLGVLGGEAGLMLFAVGIMMPLIFSAISARSFGGVTGDVFGALNELVRLSSILVFVSV